MASPESLKLYAPPAVQNVTPSSGLLRSARRWLFEASHVLRALERAPILIAESEELSKVHVIMRVMHLHVGGRRGRCTVRGFPTPRVSGLLMNTKHGAIYGLALEPVDVSR